MKNTILSRLTRQTDFNGATQIRSLWEQLNELRGLTGSATLTDLDLSTLKQRFAALRDEIGAHFIDEWGLGPLGQAVFHHRLPTEQCELLRIEQFEIFDGISSLSADADELFATNSATHASRRALMDRFGKIDSMLIAHESRKRTLLRAVLGSI